MQADIQERAVATTESFKSGNSVAVRLPREMGVVAGIEIDLEKEGDAIHLRPKCRTIDVSPFLPGVPGLAEWWRKYQASGVSSSMRASSTGRPSTSGFHQSREASSRREHCDCHACGGLPTDDASSRNKLTLCVTKRP